MHFNRKVPLIFRDCRSWYGGQNLLRERYWRKPDGDELVLDVKTRSDHNLRLKYSISPKKHHPL
jgi:hypothetical protein